MGTVLEKLDANEYVYLKVRTAAGDVWTAVPRADVAVGQNVAIEQPYAMQSFQSKALGRTFDVVYFGELHRPRSEAAIAEKVSPVEPATGPDARTVEEVFRDRDKLADKHVVVRGQVTKVNEGILDRNWVHLQDGSGDPQHRTHDLTFTTSEPVAVGEVVTMRGTVRTNRDFGAGYVYSVIVESASIQR